MVGENVYKINQSFPSAFFWAVTSEMGQAVASYSDTRQRKLWTLKYIIFKTLFNTTKKSPKFWELQEKYIEESDVSAVWFHSPS